MKKYNFETPVIIILAIISVSIIVFSTPALFIYALNSLFDLNIAYTLKTLISAFILLLIVRIWSKL